MHKSNFKNIFFSVINKCISSSCRNRTCKPNHHRFQKDKMSINRRARSHYSTYNDRDSFGGSITLVTDIKDWKLRDPPSYLQLPINENPEYNIPVAVNNAVFSKVPTEPPEGEIRLVCVSEDGLTELLDIDPLATKSSEFVDLVAGKFQPEGGYTVCHRYGGYQFGHWADQLGDGRAHIIGEYVNCKGDIYQPQLKGCGETPYSRFGDGRAVLRSSIREMIGSEACHYLGIPTTRGLALVVSDDHKVWRDKTYGGAPELERVAVLLRAAPSWYRIGSLEILNKRREPELLRKLCDFIIENHFPMIDPKSRDKLSLWYKEVAHRNLDLVASWQGFGFVHGVLNSDNVSLHGITLDFGPFGFMDKYTEAYVPNTSDDAGRYSYKKQPIAMLWNIDKFFDAIEPILNNIQRDLIEDIRFMNPLYIRDKTIQTFLQKLGLSLRDDDDDTLIKELLCMMESQGADFTACFRQLAMVDAKDLANESACESLWSVKKLLANSGWESWVEQYCERLQMESVNEEVRRGLMNVVNPVYVPRNWMMEEAIRAAEKNDFSEVNFLLELFRKPYEVNEQAEERGYSAEPPSWGRGLVLSCSS